MEYSETPPSLEHAAWIHCLWSLRGSGGGMQPVVPDGRPEIVIHLGEPFAQVDADGTRRRQAQVMVSGQLTRPINLSPSADADIVGIRLSAAAAGRLVPISEITDEVVPLHQLHPRLAGALLDAAVSPQPPAQRLAAIGTVLRRFARHAPDALSAACVRALDGGARRLWDVAAAGGVTPRTLQRRFRDDVGITAKMYHRIARFRRGAQIMRHTWPTGFARAAALAGYYDQAHLIRDFRRFTGRTPRRFFQAAPDLALSFLGDGSAPDE